MLAIAAAMGTLAPAVPAAGDTTLEHLPPADGGWGHHIDLMPARTHGFYGGVAVTPLDEVLSVWSLHVWDESHESNPNRDHLKALAVPPAGPAGIPAELTDDSDGGADHMVVVDGQGGALANWVDSERDVHAAYRDPVLGWTAGVELGRTWPITPGPDGVGWSTAAMGEHGTAAVAWPAGTPGAATLEVAVRSPLGTWAPAVTVESGLSGPPGIQLGVTGEGEVHVAWTDWETGRLTVTRLGATGAPSAREVVADYGVVNRLFLDADANAVMLWTKGDGTRLVSERPAGASFGAPQAIQAPIEEDPWLAVDDSGRKTLVVTDGTVDVSSAPFGEPLRPVASFRTESPWSEPVVATSPEGEAVLAWRADEAGHWVSTWRSEDEPFGPVVDVEPLCQGHGDFADLAINDSRRTAIALTAEGRRRLAIGRPPGGTPRQGCAAPHLYEPVGEERAGEPPEAQPPLPPEGLPVPPLPAPRPQLARGGPVIESLTLRRRGRRLSARLRLACPVRCVAKGTITLRRGTAVRARGTLKRKAFAGRRTFTVPLRRARVRALSARRAPRLRARLVVASGGARPVLRAQVPVGR